MLNKNIFVLIFIVFSVFLAQQSNASTSREEKLTQSGFQSNGRMDIDPINNRFIVSWLTCYDLPLNNCDIIAQRFDTTGGKLGDEINITSDPQRVRLGDIAVNPQTGDFIIVWTSGPLSGVGPDGDGQAVFGSLYSKEGIVIKNKILINSFVSGNQSSPSVRFSPDGLSFIVVWSSENQDGNNLGVFAKRYNASAQELPRSITHGNGIGNEFQVNSTIAGQQSTFNSSNIIDFMNNNNFVIIWNDYSPNTGNRAFGQIFNENGDRIGAEFMAGESGIPPQNQASLIVNRYDNSFVITWTNEENPRSNSFGGVYGQQFNSKTEKIGPIFNINGFRDISNPSYVTPLASADTDYGYIVTYGSFGFDGSTFGTAAQKMCYDNQKTGQELTVNTLATDNQQSPSDIAFLANKLLILWNSAGNVFPESDVFLSVFTDVNKCTVIPLDTTPPETNIISITNGEGIVLTNNSKTSSNIVDFTFSGADDVTPSDQLVFECSLDGGVFVPCVSSQSYFDLSLGTHTFAVRAKDAIGNIDQTPTTFSWAIVLPSSFYSEIQNAPNWLRLRTSSGSVGKPENDILKSLPNKWAVKVLNTTDVNSNNVDIDGYRWYQVEDKTDGAVGWIAARSLADGIIYLDYHANLQTDLENKAAVQLTTSAQRKPVILNAVETYYTASPTDNSLYGGGGGRDGNNNFQRFIQGSAFPKELILAIAAQESGSGFDNEICSSAKDGGIGILQITSSDLKGLGSGLDSFSRKNDCRSNTESFSRYYSNALQGIYANIKDGFRTLQTKYRQKCPKDSIVISGYTFTCQDIEKILTTWGYNGFGKDQVTGLYTGNYLKHVSDKLRNLAAHFTGTIYPNTDNLIEKLEVANNNKQVIRVYSPVTFSVIDELGRITGIQDNIVQEEIPNSLYESDAEGAVIFFPSASYRYRMVGTSTGTYRFAVDYTKEGVLKTFNAVNIPVIQGEIHEYVIDWDALDRGERGVTIHLDYEGNGVPDQVIHSDNALTDIEPPTITTPQLNPEYFYKSKLQLQFSAADVVSGIANVTATLNGSPVINNQLVTLTKPGVNIFAVTATDNDGNISTLVQHFNVLYRFGGFLSPIKTDGRGVYKQGRTLPVKFELKDVDNNPVHSIPAYLYLAKITNGIAGTEEIPLSVSSADTGNQFRYHSGEDHYIYNLSTDSITPGTWQLKAVLDSGQVVTTIISVR